MGLHRDPQPFTRVHVVAPATTLNDSGLYDTPETRAQMERVLDAAETFEIVNGRAVQITNPVAGQPIPGVRYF